MEVTGPLRRVVLGPDRRPPPARSPRWARFRPYGVPLGLLALIGLTVANGTYLLENRELSQLMAMLLAVWAVLPVVIAVRQPLLAWRLAYPLLFLGTLGAVPSESWPWSPVQILGFLLVLAALAAREESAVIAWVTALNVVPVFLFAPRANAWGAAMLVVAIALAGDVVSRRRRSREELARQSELTELEQARRAVLEERARIAREMHDVVAHHMSMIAVQAETAPYRISGLPPPALTEFTAIAAGAREALTDMRRLLGVLRAETDESPRAPQPGLSDVPALVEAARRAGIEVRLAATEVGDVPEAVGLAAYRIVQEALANAARHAPGGPVLVSLNSKADELRVEIDNGPSKSATMPESGPDTPEPPATNPRTIGGTAGGPGHGLIGMRERSTLLGGTLKAGPEPSGGYRVAARLPLPSPPPSPPSPSSSPPPSSPPSPPSPPSPSPSPQGIR
ncbi:two-component sensor histidine kinase [Actinoplanes sp. ATCC 53533]|uniref:sensor histidine kinase n=1 Tax=Actinoplanes sp. ATCC 53533 TaxID=1288362 RepID=UPI000F76F70C|nr:histidine kinase [Actinoplanes sp. ATCC 53533]RSM72168.1 two-component sensor histidine kinase [Actinoplanes sp. ATCC 53533]